MFKEIMLQEVNNQHHGKLQEMQGQKSPACMNYS